MDAPREDDAASARRPGRAVPYFAAVFLAYGVFSVPQFRFLLVCLAVVVLAAVGIATHRSRPSLAGRATAASGVLALLLLALQLGLGLLLAAPFVDR
ncbi:hypothetical protein FOF52_21025 [Thermobifida alba]|uniref:Uncharacterized protein n=1 Tax=Thermobifida alba TaxID=53522 RepID=A0ABY4L5Y9_THEAE|nr:hypothetical protein [Thermobifida alba]UPT23113.1 hypothetical protein FOF52_21025 [Thermobifida alba]HLU96782.1 hypothetical protein [Thermobifida alba]